MRMKKKKKEINEEEERLQEKGLSVMIFSWLIRYTSLNFSGIGHDTNNHLRPISLLPKITSFRKAQLLVKKIINNYEIEREVI